MTKGLPKVFLAIGMKGMEAFLKKQLSKEYQFVGEAIYREGVLNNALQCNPDIIILRETLNGSKNILDLVYELRLQLPDTRIIFLASDRKPGDMLLAELVSNGVYDIMTGNRLSAPDLINLIREPNKFSDVAIYRPKMTINKQTKETLFEAPPVKEVVKHVKQTVFVEGDLPILPPTYGQDSKPVGNPTPSNEEKDKKPKRNRRRFLKMMEKEEKETTSNPSISEETSSEPPIISFPPPSLDKEDTLKIPSMKTEHSHPTSSNSIPKEQPTSTSETSNAGPLVQFDVPPVSKEEQKEALKGDQPILVLPEDNEKKESKSTENTNPTVLVSTPKETIPTKRNESFLITNSKQKILTFVGGEHGVGNSQVAFNTALALGKQGFKTIFIELKEQGSTIEYLYQLALVGKGLDYAFLHLAKKEFMGLEGSIIRMDEVRSQNTNSLLADTYRLFPNNVDFLFFSPDYVLEPEEYRKKIEPAQLKELCMHLFFQSGYHFIVLDAEPDLFNAYTEVALGFGTHVFYTITQDVCHIGRAVRNIAEMNKRINLTNKLYYIVNKFDETAALSRRDIEDWLKAKVETTIPMLYKEFVNANMNAQPILMTTKDKQFKQSFDEMVEHILRK